MKHKKQKELVHVTETGRTFKQKNANPVCRRSITNRFGDTIALMGRHGFEWNVTIQRHESNVIKSVKYNNRKEAIAYYRQMCNEYSVRQRRIY